MEFIFCSFFLSPQIIEELSSRLEKRESQLLVVSKDKARLEEECDNLKEWVKEPVLQKTICCCVFLNDKWL